MNALLLSLILSAPPQQEPCWPDYRGPGLDGHAPAGARLPLSWSEQQNVAWKTPIWGRGWSSPVLADGRIWLTTADPGGERLAVLCVDLDSGEVLLDRVLIEVPEPAHRNDLNSYASPSPVLGGGRVILSFGSEGTFGLDSETFEPIWSRTDLHCDHMEGPGSSPLLLEDRLVQHYDGGDVQYVVALSLEDGKTLWRATRTADLQPLLNDRRKAYGTPVPVQRGERTILVSSGALATYGYDAANGEEVWRVSHPGFSTSARPLVHGDRVLVNTGFMRPELWSLELGGEGDVTDSNVAWKLGKTVASMATGVLLGDRLYHPTDGGIVSCHDLMSGERIWRSRMVDEVSASILAAGDRMYLFDRTGKCVIFEHGDEAKVLGENTLDEGCMASPAVAGNALIVRTTGHLYRIEEPSKAR